MAVRYQNDAHTTGRVPGFYANNRLYKDSYTRNDWQTRTSRRIHDGFNLQVNYGLDTTSDDVNSSPYSSPYYVNGRYNSDNLVTQRANSASVQGIKYLNSIHDEKDSTSQILTRKPEDNPDEATQTTITLWQGKQIKFSLPYSGNLVGNTIRLRNTDGCTGILSIYLSATDSGRPLMETSVDLCEVSTDKFETFELRGITTIEDKANPKGIIYVRMEIWDEISNERSANPFNTGRKVEIAATGLSNHDECVYELQDKNVPVVTNPYEYVRKPARPLIGFIYNNWESVPVDRLDNMKTGATVSYNKYRYDIMCCKNDISAELLIYDKEMNDFVRRSDNQPLHVKIDGRVTQLNIAQVTDTEKKTWVYYVDGYSPLQRFQLKQWESGDDIESQAYPVGSADNITVSIDEQTWYNSDLGGASGTYIFEYHNGNWQYNGSNISLATYGITLSGGTPAEGSTITVIYTVSAGGTKKIQSIQFVDARPVIAASLIMFHNNRLYLAGFRNDPNLVQISSIDEAGPNYSQFPYRFYAPNRSPYDTSLNPITALTEYASDQIMISFRNGFSIYATYGSAKSGGLETSVPTQVSTWTDSAGVRSQGDIVNYKGTLYSFDEKEGIRRYNGALWNRLPNSSIDSHYDRVDMDKPRKLWGFANKLYFNYTDRLDGKKKCLVWDQQMNYQQYPWFQDIDIPFCDARSDETEYLIGIHPDYPCIMQLYAEDTWRRLDSPIVFERHTKYLSMPGNSSDIILKRVQNKVIANSNRWWWFGLSYDKQELEQHRGSEPWYRVPCWDTITDTEPQEYPFPNEDVYEENAVSRLAISNLRIRCTAIQERIKCKTFRNQANLVSVEFECYPRQYN